MAGGRPSKYTTELGIEICMAISESSNGIKVLCAENPKWPSHSTIRKWIFENKEFSDKYDMAKQEQADFLADEILQIADDKDGDLLEGQFGANGNPVNVSRARLQIDARKWIACKLKPKKYGDKLDLTTDGKSFIQNVVVNDSKTAEDINNIEG